MSDFKYFVEILFIVKYLVLFKCRKAGGGAKVSQRISCSRLLLLNNSCNPFNRDRTFEVDAQTVNSFYEIYIVFYVHNKKRFDCVPIAVNNGVIYPWNAISRLDWLLMYILISIYMYCKRWNNIWKSYLDTTSTFLKLVSNLNVK